PESEMRSDRLLAVSSLLPVFVVGLAEAAATQTTNALNLRAGPSIHYRVRAVVPTGASIDILSCGSEWCRLAWGNYKGYAEGRFLRTHVTAMVSPLKELKPEATGEGGTDKERQEARLNVCKSQWGLADLNGDGVLTPKEIAHYNSAIRAQGQPALPATDRLNKTGFVAECSAVNVRE